MARRKPNIEIRYIRNASPSKLEVHDLDNEQTGGNECQIDEIIRAENARYLHISNTEAALKRWLAKNPSYDGCKYCLPHLHRK